MAGKRGEAAWFRKADATDGMSKEQKDAIKALKALRAAGRRDARPARAKTLAEAEAQAWLLQRDDVVSPAVLREQGLTGKSARGYRAGVARLIDVARED